MNPDRYTGPADHDLDAREAVELTVLARRAAVSRFAKACASALGEAASALSVASMRAWPVIAPPAICSSAISPATTR